MTPMQPEATTTAAITAAITQALATIQARIAVAATAAGRQPADIALVAVSKTFRAAHIEAALHAGQRRFGENRVQEAADKHTILRDAWPDLELHLIGPLQSNKVRQAVALFDVIQTVDRPYLAAVLAREMERSGRRPACFIQVNTGEEPQKSGISPREADAFITACQRDYALPLVGLMGLPPASAEPAPHLALLRKIAQRNGLPCLSMGMSGDFEPAIQFGATHVRIGSAIFGGRGPHLDITHAH